MYFCGIMTYCPKRIKEVINWFIFRNIMEYTVYNIYNEIALLPSLLKMCSMFQMRFRYDKESDDKNDMKIIAISCF